MASATSTLSSSLLPNHSLSLTRHANRTTKVSTFTILAQKKVKKLRKVILKEDIMNVGNRGELIEVRFGYYRNYLLPKGMADVVTPELIKEMKKEEERIEAEKQRVKEEALLLARMFETVGAFKVKRQGGKGKQIFGTVTSQDFVDIVKANLQRDLDKRLVSMPEIRETGAYTVELKLHPDVTARVILNVYAN